MFRSPSPATEPALDVASDAAIDDCAECGAHLSLRPSSADAPAKQSLTRAHYHEFAVSQSRAKPIRKAARVANFNGWSCALMAALSTPFALFSAVALLMTVGLSVVAYNEFQGRKRLVDFDPTGATRLGWNQIGLLAMIAGYSSWMLVANLTGTSAFTRELQTIPELADELGTLGDVDGLIKQLTVGFYGSCIVLSVFVQGLTARYYFTRRILIEGFLRETPEWAREFQRCTADA